MPSAQQIFAKYRPLGILEEEKSGGKGQKVTLLCVECLQNEAASGSGHSDDQSPSRWNRRE